MLGIKDYIPDFSTTTFDFREKHKFDLINLVGKEIDCYYLQWDLNRNEWNEDGPIILVVGENQYEFTAFKLDKYSLTVNKIDLSEKLNWYGANNEMPLIWKKNPILEINEILNSRIDEIYLLEFRVSSEIIGNDEKNEFLGQMTDLDILMVGIEFKLNGFPDCLHLSNGLDCNVLKFETTENDHKNRMLKIETK